MRKSLEVLLALSLTASSCNCDGTLVEALPQAGQNVLNELAGLNDGQVGTSTSSQDGGVSESKDTGVLEEDSGYVFESPAVPDASVPVVVYENALRVPLNSGNKYHITSNGFITARGKVGYAVVSPAEG